MDNFDLQRAWLKGHDLFPRFKVPDHGVPLSEAGLSDDEYLQIVERGGERRALLVRQMSYHHVAEGTLGGEPFAVTF